jgi:plastocyanin
VISRRALLRIGGLALAGPALPRFAMASNPVEIDMVGDAHGGAVRFAPRGLRIAPGATVTWRNADPGNAHTSTAFHPDNMDHPLRIPAGAKPWNSDYLLPGEAFSVTLAVPGVYDYFCIPHEMAGMVGRIVVASPGTRPLVAAKGMEDTFPSVESIMRLGVVDR